MLRPQWLGDNSLCESQKLKFGSLIHRCSVGGLLQVFPVFQRAFQALRMQGGRLTRRSLRTALSLLPFDHQET